MKQINNAQLTRELTSIIHSIILNYSSLDDKGRYISGVNLSHIMHEVIPAEIATALRDKQIFEEE